MELDYYQKEAHKTSLHNTPVIYPTLGLTGEAGEVADKILRMPFSQPLMQHLII